MPPPRKPPPPRSWLRASPRLSAVLVVCLTCGAALAALRLRGASPALPLHACSAPDGLHVIYCGADLMAVTAEAVPAPPGRVPPYGEVRVMNAHGATAAAERSHFILQSWVNVAQRSSSLTYIEVGAELFLRVLYGGDGHTANIEAQPAPRVLLLGLGAGALPTALRRLCGARPALRGCAGLRLTAVDASADALRIARSFVIRDDGHVLRFVHDTAEHFVARSARPAALARLAPGIWDARWDLIVNDAYAGARGVARDAAFVADVARALRPGTGVYCVNALSTGADEGARGRAEDAMAAVFGAGAVRVEAEDGSNAWLCATAPHEPRKIN